MGRMVKNRKAKACRCFNKLFKSAEMMGHSVDAARQQKMVVRLWWKKFKGRNMNDHGIKTQQGRVE